MKTPWILALVALCAVTGSVLFADDTPQQGDALQQVVLRNPERSEPVTPFVFYGDLRDLPAPVPWRPGDPIREIPRRTYPKPGTSLPVYTPGPDPLLPKQPVSTEAVDASFSTPTRNFAGAVSSGLAPSDTNGAVGPNYYIQTINASGGSTVRVFDKAEPTPNIVTTFTLDSLATGGPCASGHGDPVVLYDRFASRWVITEFSTSGNNLCVYISQTPDPINGGWFAYGFTAPSFPDYPKYGIWPTDANGGQGSYTVTANDGGPGAYALDRGAMLAGNAATFQRFTLPNLPGFSFESATPVDVDGPTPPDAMDPALIMRHRDTENQSGPAAPGDLLEMWEFDVDWVTSANSTLTQVPSIDVSEFDSDLCGLTSFFCFPQPNTSTTLDPLREVIMHRLVMYRYDDHDSIVGNLVTDLDGTNHGGIRWFEIRRTGGGAWSLYQEGTYSIDSDHRWMGASGIDQSGNIALAYSVSSTSTFPGLRYTGRLADEPLGIMSEPETVIHSGTSSSSTNRWGDYGSMSLDPVDDCTFWFNSQDTDGSSSWRTQVASFKFELCGCQLAPSALTITAQDVADNEIELTWNDADLDTVVEYLVQRSTSQGGPYQTIATVDDSSLGMTGGPGYVYSDTTVSGGTTYYYIVRASDGQACKSPASNEEGVTASGICFLRPTFGGLTSLSNTGFSTCTLDLAWNSAISNCAGAVDYTIYRSETPGFIPGANNLLAENVIGTTFSDVDLLVSGQTYYYVVRARDVTIDLEDVNSVQLSGVPSGNANVLFADDAGDTGAAQLTTMAPWFIEGTEGNLGPNVYKTGDYGNNTCAGLTTPTITLGLGSQLQFSSRYDLENSWDKGEVQISVDGGSNWTRVPMAYPGNSTNTSDACGLPTGSYFTGSAAANWVRYTADLSAWDGMDAMIRFQISSDSGGTRTGWWIDDISVTIQNNCATGSACPDNPTVDISPDGPATVCEYDIPPLSANVSGGTPPFVYEWIEDGVVVPGADQSTFQPTSVGTHSYNVRVKAPACPSAVTDGIDTVFTTQGKPAFAGLNSAVNPQTDTCSVDLTWSAGSTACAGPLQYFVYRDTGSPVSVEPANLVAAGLAGTAFNDSTGLVNNTAYHYVVQAQDATTGIFDGNGVERSATPDGPGSGLMQYYFEDFEDPADFAGWTVTTGPGAHTCGEWALASSSTKRPSGGSGSYAIADNECAPLLPRTSTTLTSPVVDLDLTNVTSVTLEFDMYFNWDAANGDELGSVEIWNGSSWEAIWIDSAADLNGHQTFDITAQAANNPDFRIRFDYQGAVVDRWFSVDNVEITTDRFVVCSTFDAPTAVPDGRLGTSPMRAERLDFSGNGIEVTWDTASCAAAPDYNLIFGSLASVGAYAVSGSDCSLGTSGTHTWNGVASGDLWFLVVGADGAGSEGSWGFDGTGAERNGFVASGECGVVSKSPGNYCP